MSEMIILGPIKVRWERYLESKTCQVEVPHNNEVLAKFSLTTTTPVYRVGIGSPLNVSGTVEAYWCSEKSGQIKASLRWRPRPGHGPPPDAYQGIIGVWDE